MIVFGLLKRTSLLTLTMEEQKSGTDKTLIFQMGGDADHLADSPHGPPVAPDSEAEARGRDGTQLEKPDGETPPPQLPAAMASV